MSRNLGNLPHIIYHIAVSMNIDCSISKVNSGLLGKFVSRSFRLVVKRQWRHVTEQSCVENQVKPSLEDEEDAEQSFLIHSTGHDAILNCY